MAIIVAGCGGDSAPDPKGTAGGGGTHSTGGAGGVPTGGAGGEDDALPPIFDVDGFVRNEHGDVVADAMVKQGGVEATTTVSAADGSFSIQVHAEGFLRPALIASKTAHRTRGIELFDVPTEPVEIVILTAALPDNPDYTYLDPGDGIDLTKEDCTHCHTRFVQQFLTSKHAEAARDPLVQDLYAGVSRAHGDSAACAAAGGSWKQGKDPGTANAIDKCYLGGGVLPDLNPGCGGAAEDACDDPTITNGAPTAFGACADCHAPGINGIAGGRDLHDAQGLAYDIGVSCDPCHKVKDIDLDLPPGVGNRLILQRPAEPGRDIYLWEPLFFGPFADVANPVMGGATPQPKFKQAVYCAGCHEQNQPALMPGEQLDAQRWPDGLPVHSTYSEWLDGPYNQPTTPCQFCHMPSTFDLVNSLDLATVENQSIKFGFPRAPEDTRQHIFRSPLHGDPRLIDGALFVSVNTSLTATSLTADVSITNIGCGHAIPTGEPMRSLVVVVEAQGSCGKLAATDGLTINDLGGARATGVVGVDLSAASTTLTWSAASAIANTGDVVRAVRPTGNYDDYDGIGFFADPQLTPEQKGIPILAPVGEATVVSVNGNDLTLDVPLSLQADDIVYVGDGWPATASDGQPSLHLAGAPGHTFARVLTDSTGARGVAHYRAIDMVSDNRIAPGGNAVTSHTFAVPSGCSAPSVTATVLYRPVPLAMATLRGWDAADHIIGTASAP